MFWGWLYFKKVEEFTIVRLYFLGVNGLSLCLRGYNIKRVLFLVSELSSLVWFEGRRQSGSNSLLPESHRRLEKMGFQIFYLLSHVNLFTCQQNKIK